MTRFRLFDAVELREPLTLAGGGAAVAGTPGVIVEVLRDGEAYMVELFGGWVKADVNGALVAADPTDPEAFMETLGLELLPPRPLRWVKSALETGGIRSRLLMTLEEMPEAMVAEVADFAEFLRQKQHRRATVGE